MLEKRPLPGDHFYHHYCLLHLLLLLLLAKTQRYKHRIFVLVNLTVYYISQCFKHLNYNIFLNFSIFADHYSITAQTKCNVNHLECTACECILQHRNDYMEHLSFHERIFIFKKNKHKLSLSVYLFYIHHCSYTESRYDN